MKSTHYNLTRAWEPKIIGVKDGGSQAEIIRDGFTNKENYDRYMDYFHSKHLKENFKRTKTFPPFDISLEYIKMRKGAKLTDFISFFPVLTCAHYLISDKVARIFSTFKMPEYKLYPVVIDNNGELLKNYSLFYNPPFDFDCIAFDKSIFYTGDKFLGKIVYHRFKNFDEYYVFSQSNLVEVEKIVTKEGFDKELDYFDLRYASLPFISKDLKETFEMAGITGIKFIETTEPELFFEE